MRSGIMSRSLQNPYSRRCESKCRGSSLIEVMLAVALMAVTALGLIAGQLWTAREARAMAMREHAAWIADSVAEAMCVPSAGDSAIRQWSARAALVLPHGEASVRDNDGVSAARVTWAALRDMPYSDDVIDKPAPCGGADLPAGSSCVALAFAR
jgi:Tfp pilus assembly protein PilV